jgi:transposase-like protein
MTTTTREMRMSNRMTSETRMALIDAYKAWSPESGVSVDELAARHGVTKSAMYAMLRRENVPLHTGRGNSVAGVRGQEPLMAEMGRIALEVILEQRDELRAEVARLRAEVARLRGLCARNGIVGEVVPVSGTITTD